MKRLLTTTATIFALTLMGSQAAFATTDFGGVNLNTTIKPTFTLPAPSMDNITCGVGGTIKYVNSKDNQITYWIEYTNKGVGVTLPYQIAAAARGEVFVSLKGDTSLALGTGKVKFATGKTTGTFTFAINRTDTMQLQANINGKKCTSLDLATIKTNPVVSPAINTNIVSNIDLTLQNGAAASPAGQNPAAAPAAAPAPAPAPSAEGEGAPANVPPVPVPGTCKVIAEAMVSNNVLLMGAALQEKDFPAGSYNYVIRGYSESAPNNIREFTGNFKAPGNGFVLNGDRGFLFELPLGDKPETYVIKGSLGDKQCSLVSFAAPSRASVAAASSTNGSISNGSSTAGNTSASASVGAAAGVQTFGQTPEDATQAQSLNLAANSSDNGASQTALLEDSGMPDYLMYILIAVVVGLGGTIVYLVGFKKPRI